MKQNLLKFALCAMALLPMGAWADVTTINTNTLWLFNDLNVSSWGGAFPSNTSGSNTDLNEAGLIYTGNSGSSLQPVSPAESVTINGVAVATQVSQAIRLQESYNDGWTDAFQGSSRNGETYNKTLARSLVVNVTVPGTLYVLVKHSGDVSEANKDRAFELLFNPNSNRTYPHTVSEVVENYRYINTKKVIKDNNNTVTELSLFGDGAGAFWFRAGLKSDVYAIKFIPAYSMTAAAGANGQINVTTEAISSDYYSSGIAAGIKFYAENTSVSMTASAAEGYRFVSWEGVDTQDGATATVTMNENKTVTANFIQTFTLTTNATNGTIERSPNAVSYDIGTVVTLTATPDDGYRFVSWEGVDTQDGTTATVTMNTNKTVTANFAYYSVNVTIGAHEWASFSNNFPVSLAIPDGVTAYGASGCDKTNKKIVLVPYTNVIPPNTGVVLNGTADTYTFTYTTESGSYSGSNNYMVAVTDDNTQIALGEYVLMWDYSASSVIFQRVARGTTISVDDWKTKRPKLNAGQAYLSEGVLETVISAPMMGSRSIGIDDDGTTGIRNVINRNEDENVFYTLEGVRVDNPTKGIYIKNGKKIIMK